MVHSFINEMPSMLENLNKALFDKDWDNVYRIAHRLKPNFMMVGMKQEENIAGTIEKMAKSETKDTHQIEMFISQLSAASELAYPILKEKLNI